MSWFLSGINFRALLSQNNLNTTTWDKSLVAIVACASSTLSHVVRLVTPKKFNMSAKISCFRILFRIESIRLESEKPPDRGNPAICTQRVTAYSYRIIAVHQRWIKYRTYSICGAHYLHSRRARLNWAEREEKCRSKREIMSNNERERESGRLEAEWKAMVRALGIINVRPAHPIFHGIDPFLTVRKCKQWWNLREDRSIIETLGFCVTLIPAAMLDVAWYSLIITMSKRSDYYCADFLTRHPRCDTYVGIDSATESKFRTRIFCTANCLYAHHRISRE